MTAATAAELGWDVEYLTDGAWGHPATRRCWRIRHCSWDSAWHSKCFDTEADALFDIAARIAYDVGLRGTPAERVGQLNDHLARVRPVAA